MTWTSRPSPFQILRRTFLKCQHEEEEGTLKLMVKNGLGKSLMMTELVREYEQVDRMGKSWVLTELSSKQSSWSRRTELTIPLG